MLCLSFVSMKECNSNNKLFCFFFLSTESLWKIKESVPNIPAVGVFMLFLKMFQIELMKVTLKKNVWLLFLVNWCCFSSFWLIASTKTCPLLEEETRAMRGWGQGKKQHAQFCQRTAEFRNQPRDQGREHRFSGSAAATVFWESRPAMWRRCVLIKRWLRFLQLENCFLPRWIPRGSVHRI